MSFHFKKVGEVIMYRGGHAKSCRCAGCLRKRLHEFQVRMEFMGDVLPPDLDHSVPVKQHWRRQPGYLKSDPLLRDAVFDNLIRPAIKENKVLQLRTRRAG